MKFKAVIWDVYGTLVEYNIGDLEDALHKKTRYIPAIKKALKVYNIDNNAEKANEKILSEIRNAHKRKERRGVKFPEVIIEKVYKKILGISDEKAKQFALFMERNVNKPKFYKGTKNTLIKINNLGLKQGILSNSQFYTPLMIEEQLNKEIYSIFDKKLCLWSYKEGCSKPNPRLMVKLKKRLGKIKPSEVLFIGNDLQKDIYSAHKAGFKTCLLTKDIKGKKKVNPDYTIKEIPELLKIIKEK